MLISVQQKSYNSIKFMLQSNKGLVQNTDMKRFVTSGAPG